MLDHIGDIDPEFRDELIYGIFSAWIDEKEMFDEEQIRYITYWATLCCSSMILFFQRISLPYLI
ncbi:hypothetical protein LBYZC6_43580 [Lacrimispora brassicae]